MTGVNQHHRRNPQCSRPTTTPQSFASTTGCVRLRMIGSCTKPGRHGRLRVLRARVSLPPFGVRQHVVFGSTTLARRREALLRRHRVWRFSPRSEARNFDGPMIRCGAACATFMVLLAACGSQPDVHSGANTAGSVAPSPAPHLVGMGLNGEHLDLPWPTQS